MLALGLVFALLFPTCADLPNVPLTGYSGDLTALIGGYCEDNTLVPGLITRPTYYLPPPTHFETRALWQAEGLIEQTAAVRGLTLDGVDGYISLLSPSVLGWKVWLRVEGGEWLSARNVDGARREDMYYHAVAVGSGLELSYELAEQLGVMDWVNADGTHFRHIEVCVTDSDPNQVCADPPVSFTNWFLENVRFEDN